MKEVENPVVVNSLWRDKEKELEIICECAGCQEAIFSGEAVYEFEDYGETVLIHQKAECCMNYVAEMSYCKVAGES